ncbi:hypothetical protein HPB50_011956 [Hyalomma asiaticum]|uniref:Uncharacterized protein n=1 Tax=Hyalomma asiaticum TaxID=266040 RepID=A0ACB7T7G0_HYAAI|nr:hypothetical protein HPB50_011956 [Hyalomma asiaticum]
MIGHCVGSAPRLLGLFQSSVDTVSSRQRLTRPFASVEPPYAFAHSYRHRSSSRLREYMSARGGQILNDPTTWVSAVKDVAARHSWPDHMTKSFAEGRLRGAAEAWNRFKGSAYVTWSAWSAALTSVFAPLPSTYDTQFMEMRSRRQAETEDIAAYIYEKLRLLHRCNIEWASPAARQYVVDGLFDPTHAAILSAQSFQDDLETFVRRAVLLQDTAGRRLDTHSQQEPTGSRRGRITREERSAPIDLTPVHQRCSRRLPGEAPEFSALSDPARTSSSMNGNATDMTSQIAPAHIVKAEVGRNSHVLNKANAPLGGNDRLLAWLAGDSGSAERVPYGLATAQSTASTASPALQPTQHGGGFPPTGVTASKIATRARQRPSSTAFTAKKQGGLLPSRPYFRCCELDHLASSRNCPPIIKFANSAVSKAISRQTAVNDKRQYRKLLPSKTLNPALP